MVLSILSVKWSPEITGGMDTSGLNAFNDYVSGFIVMTIFIGLGATLYLLGRAANSFGSHK